MMQVLNNIWIALSSENVRLVNWLLIPCTLIEPYLFMNLFLIVFDVKASNKQKILYVLSISILSIISLYYIPQPVNVFINYTCMFIFIKLIFKLNILRSFISLLISIFVFGILNVLLQNPYIKFFNITYDNLATIPIYRISFLIILYIIVFIICIILKKFRNIKFSLDFLDMLDKKTLKILIANLIVGFLHLCIQLIINAYYMDIVPIIITLLSFVLLISFLILSIYSFSRMIKLATTTRDLESAEEYNKSLEILYDKVKGFQHDFNNIVSTIDGYIDTNDITNLKDYFEEVKKDCKITNNLSILNPRIINNPGIYSLLNNKYFKATNLGVNVDFEFFLDLNTLKINIYEFSRMLGILIDNAIEEAEKCEEKLVRIIFRREDKNKRALIIIKNTYSNKDVNIETIFEKGISGKKEHSGIGLWEVKNYIKKNKKLDLFTNKNERFFIQELSVYDN